MPPSSSGIPFFLDIVFTCMHLALIGFNLCGWVWRKTRKAHLIVLAATAVSWFVFGIWYGWGYCFLTDWHWAVKRQLGETNLPNSFIKYAADRITGVSFDAQMVDAVTLGVFIALVVITVYVHVALPKVQH